MNISRYLTLISVMMLQLIAHAQTEQFMESVPTDYTGITFENRVIETKERNIGLYDYMYNGSGVAIADFNNDGLPDIFFCGNDAPGKLYFNLGDLTFKDVTETSGIKSNRWSTGVTVVDINNDGFLDLYICYSGPDYKTQSTQNELYINRGDETFTEEAAKWGIADNSLSTHAVFFDMDGDGDLDLFVLNHAIRNWANEAIDWFKQLEKIPADELKRFSNKLYRNNGNNTFTDVSEETGLDRVGFGLSVAVSDFDGNGLPDLFVANDYFIPDWLFLNQGDGQFTESLARKFMHTPFFSMGSDAADINNDGLVDLVVLDMTPSDHYRNKMLMASMNTAEFDFLTKAKGFVPQYMFNSLFINSGSGVMSDIAHLAGVASTDWSWAPLLADFNNDGWKDLYVTNGFLRDVNNNDWRQEVLKMMKSNELNPDSYFTQLQKATSTPLHNELFINQNGFEFKRVQFHEQSSNPSFSNGAAWGDLDGDGDLDLVVNNINQPAFILKNLSIENKAGYYLRFSLSDNSNKNLHVGAQVRIYFDGKMQMSENSFARGYQSFCEPVLHFGLGAVTKVDSVIIQWSNGKYSRMLNVAANHVYKVDFGLIETFKPKTPADNRMFWDITDLAINPAASHRENIFDDFEKEILLPHKMSKLGPALAVGDVNGDGLDDFYLGGAKNQPGMLYVQNENGFFESSFQFHFNEHRDKEEIGALFFDADGDGSLDLYVSCAGNGIEADESVLQDLFYLNDGNGNFMIANWLPDMHTSTKVVKAFDWDGDGDLDLFVGGRVISGKYPLAPRSYLLENHNGQFVDVTAKVCPELERIGMVTDAIFVDWKGENRLFVVGEWMTPECFQIAKNQWAKCKDVFNETDFGWWNSIAVGDISGNGLSDILLGNVGLNNKFHPTKEKPLHLYANDMDDNGSLDIILGKHYQNEIVPVRGKECSTQQMPFLSKQVNSYHEFASSSMLDIYGADKLNQSVRLKAETFASMWMNNPGRGELKKTMFPIEAQVSPIQGFIVDDFDGDGIMDVLIAGNNFVTEVETTPYNSGKGLLLKGLGKGEFRVLPESESGVFLPGDVRVLLPIRISGENIPGIIVASNNGKLRLLMLNQSFVK
jgi:enediyne biosynthesis protein E4